MKLPKNDIRSDIDMWDNIDRWDIILETCELWNHFLHDKKCVGFSTIIKKYQQRFELESDSDVCDYHIVI